VSGAGWLSYSLQDFIMFGPQVFLRLFVRINQDIWPWPLLAVLLGFLVPFFLVSHKCWLRRLALGLISLGWMVSGYVFLVGYFGPINWPAAWFGWAFVLQGGLLGLMAVAGAADQDEQFHQQTIGHYRPAARGLVVCWIIALLVLPWLPVSESGNWQALALFGLTPWTTAAVSMLSIAVLRGPWRWLYLLLPVLWSLFSAATFWVLQTNWLLVLPVATLVFVGLGLWLSPRRVQSPG
jgi:hypothetical protein